MDVFNRLEAWRRDLSSAHKVLINAGEEEPLTVFEGAGNPVVLLHGFLGHPSSLARFAEVAGEFDRPIIAPQMNPTDSVDYQVSNLLMLLEGLGVPAHLVGHSLGGVVSVITAMESPDLVMSVSTIASPLGGSHWARLPVVRSSVLAEVRPNECAAKRMEGALSVPLLSIAGKFDPLVPVDSALAFGGVTLVVPEGHASVLWADATVDAVKLFQSTIDGL